MVDLDIVPVLVITGVGMLSAPPMVLLSETLRKATAPVRLILAFWVILMFCGVFASVANLQTQPTPLSCDEETVQTGCIHTCNETLPLREGQQVLSVQLAPITTMYRLARALAIFGSCLILMIVLAELRAWGVYRDFTVLGTSPPGRGAHLYWCCSPHTKIVLTYVFFPLCCTIYLVTMERVLLGRSRLPVGEPLSSVGQWGPVVGAALAICASLVKGLWHRRRVNRPFGPRELPGWQGQGDFINRLKHSATC